MVVRTSILDHGKSQSPLLRNLRHVRNSNSICVLCTHHAKLNRWMLVFPTFVLLKSDAGWHSTAYLNYISI